VGQKGESGCVRERLARGFGDSEIDHFGHGFAILLDDQNVRGFYVPVNNALLMRMLEGAADGQEKVQPLPGCQFVPIAEISAADAQHQFHDKVRPAALRRASIVNSGDVRMVHERQGLALRFKAGHHLLGPCPA
jgi:hypothetical protein